MRNHCKSYLPERRLNQHESTVTEMEKKKTNQDHFIELDVKKLKQIKAERKQALSSVMPDMHHMSCPCCNRYL